jgi:hypothetical protein
MKVHRVNEIDTKRERHARLIVIQVCFTPQTTIEAFTINTQFCSRVRSYQDILIFLRVQY